METSSAHEGREKGEHMGEGVLELLLRIIKNETASTPSGQSLSWLTFTRGRAGVQRKRYKEASSQRYPASSLKGSFLGSSMPDECQSDRGNNKETVLHVLKTFERVEGEREGRDTQREKQEMNTYITFIRINLMIYRLWVTNTRLPPIFQNTPSCLALPPPATRVQSP